VPVPTDGALPARVVELVSQKLWSAPAFAVVAVALIVKTTLSLSPPQVPVFTVIVNVTLPAAMSAALGV
jgi:hypothetical protein